MTATSPLVFPRRRERRVLLGVAGGFADQHGINVVVVRAALMMLSFTGGLGVLIYVIGHLLADRKTELLPPIQTPDRRRDLAVIAITAGAALLMRSSGLWLGDAAMWAVAVIVSGIALPSVMSLDRNAQAALGAPVGSLADLVGGRFARERIIAGSALVAFGVAALARGDVSFGVRIGVYATALTILGIGVLLGPWLARTVQDATDERRQRIRLDEREAMAAHLHDSVLQTLALIQRSAHDPRRTVTLARRQEAELRTWLYGSATTADTTISGAVRHMVSEVEDLYDIRIEPVVVGDRAMDEGGEALIAAIREGCVNAAKHSGSESVSVFVEVSSTSLNAFVRDRGTGFDRSVVTAERRGLSQSIEARMERVGGTATVSSSPGTGTEVHLSLALFETADE